MKSPSVIGLESAVIAMAEAGPGVAVAMNVTGVSAVTLALARFCPAVAPSVQCADAVPSEAVVDVAGVRVPPPASAVQVTVAPAYG